MLGSWPSISTKTEAGHRVPQSIALQSLRRWPLQLKFFYKWRKCQALLRLILLQLDRSLITTEEVIELEGLPRRFVLTYLDLNRAFVVRHGVLSWPAIPKWTFDYLERHYGHLSVEVSYVDKREQGDSYRRAHRSRVMNFGNLIRGAQMALTTDGIYLTARDDLLGQDGFGDLSFDVPPIEGINDERLADAVNPRVWIGPAGTLTALHHDNHNAMLCQITGNKSVLLVSPRWYGDLDNSLYCFSNVAGDIATSCSRLRDLGVSHSIIELGPGDAVFIPVGWWHACESVGPSISVTLQDLNGDTRWSQPYLGESATLTELRTAARTFIDRWQADDDLWPQIT